MKSEKFDIPSDLLAIRDEEYALFQSKLMPTLAKETVLGVRMPALRAYAKKIVGSDTAAQFLSALPHTYYDENNLHAALLAAIKSPDEAFAAVEAFLPFINNWATCDMPAPKALLDDPHRLWTRMLVWLSSDRTYTVRYALVRLTAWYLDAPYFSEKVLDAAARVDHNDYYVRMAQAWLFSIALVKQYDAALPYLIHRMLPPWVHNKAIQKAVESLRVSPETKAYLKTLKIPQGDRL